MLVKQGHDVHITPLVDLCVYYDLMLSETSYINGTNLSNNIRVGSLLYGIFSFAIRYMSFSCVIFSYC